MRCMTESVGVLLLDGWRAIGGDDQEGAYDEALRTVSARADSAKGIDKSDIGALVLWKRITAQAQWSRALMLTSDASVRASTGAAYRLANDPSLSIPDAGQAARDALRELPGMGGTAALASAVLLALAPMRMAVWDRRVGVALRSLSRYPETRIGFYRRYLSTTLELADAMKAASSNRRSFVPRDVDLALFYIAGDRAMLAAAETLH